MAQHQQQWNECKQKQEETMSEFIVRLPTLRVEQFSLETEADLVKHLFRKMRPDILNIMGCPRNTLLQDVLLEAQRVEEILYHRTKDYNHNGQLSINNMQYSQRPNRQQISNRRCAITVAEETTEHGTAGKKTERIISISIIQSLIQKTTRESPRDGTTRFLPKNSTTCPSQSIDSHHSHKNIESTHDTRIHRKCTNIHAYRYWIITHTHQFMPSVKARSTYDETSSTTTTKRSSSISR